MSRNILLIVFLSLTTVVHAQLWRCVNPLIGSKGEGRVFVGPSVPFGMVKPGPDCLSMPNAGWAPMPDPVKGFSQTHVSGTGGGQKYGNVLIQPFRRHESMTPKSCCYPTDRSPLCRASSIIAATKRSRWASTAVSLKTEYGLMSPQPPAAPSTVSAMPTAYSSTQPHSWVWTPFPTNARRNSMWRVSTIVRRCRRCLRTGTCRPKTTRRKDAAD